MALLDTDPIILTLRITAIAIGAIIGVIMILKLRRIELKVTRRYFLGATEFFIAYSICRTVFLLGAILPDPLSLSYYVGNTLGLVSIVLIIAAIESTIFTKSKHFFTYYGIVGIGVMVFDTIDFIFLGDQITAGTRTLLSIAQYACMIPLGIVILLIYLTVIIKSTGKVRKNAAIMFVAILLLMLSEMANTQDAENLFEFLVGNPDVVHYLSPIILVISLILLYYSITHYFATD